MSKFKITKLLGSDTQPTNNAGGLGEWCAKHWFLTFLLASSVIGLPVTIITAAKTKKE